MPNFSSAPLVFQSAANNTFTPVTEKSRVLDRMLGQRASTVNAYCAWLVQMGAVFELRYDEASDTYLVKSNIAEIYEYGKENKRPVAIPKRPTSIKRRTALRG